MKRTIKYCAAAMCLLFGFCVQTVGAKADVTENAEVFGVTAEAGSNDSVAFDLAEKNDEETAVEDSLAENQEEDEMDLKDPYVIVESYEISHERIIPGEPFQLTLVLKNNNSRKRVREALIDITNPIGIAPVYGTVSQIYLGDFEAGESKTVTFEYESWPSITSETLDFSVGIVSRGNTNRVTLRVPTGSDNIFNIMAMNGPAAVNEGELASVSLNFRVLGEENVSNVVLRMDCNGETIGMSQVGSLIAGTTKTQSVSFQMAKAGDYTAEFYMEYVGADGRSESEFLGTKQIEVKEVKLPDGSDQLPGSDTPAEEKDYTDIMILVLSGTLILAIFIVSAIILKKKR